VSTRRAVSLTRVTRVAFLAACLVVVLAGVRSATSIIAPFLLASFIAAVSLPALDWLRRLGARTSVAIIAVVLLNAAVLTFLGWVVLQSVTELRLALPEYIDRGQLLEQSLRTRLAGWGVAIGPDYYATFVQPERLFEMATSAARNVTSTLALGLLILLYLVFMLAESVAFPTKWRRVFGADSHGIGGAADALRQVQRYLALKTVMSVVTGVAIGLGAWALDVDFALLWGFLAFVLNYVPSIGSIVAAIPALFIALLQFGPARAVGLGSIYLLVNVVVGNFADPIIIGRELRLSPIIVLVSLVFWGWTLGLVGMFLAVPLTIALRIMLETSDSLSRYALLMGPLARPANHRPAAESRRPAGLTPSAGGVVTE
jgi:AI-2 transport protein TqsA